MPKASVLIVGCGDVGSRLATQLLDAHWQVYGLRRSIERLPTGVIGVAGDLFSEQCPAQWPTGPIDYVVYSAAATSAGSVNTPGANSSVRPSHLKPSL